MARVRPHRPVVIQVVCGLVLGLVLAGAYLAAMRLTLDLSIVKNKADADYRDSVYLAIHGGLLLLAAVAGFSLGKWLNGLGVAYGLMVVVVVALFMVGAQLGSYQLACGAGRNGVIRHWTC